ncbi:MAG TPA: hypothetical protein PKY61_03005, partial [bacterium]|nr:hypothetical protein [bacterium]
KTALISAEALIVAVIILHLIYIIKKRKSTKKSILSNMPTLELTIFNLKIAKILLFSNIFYLILLTKIS